MFLSQGLFSVVGWMAVRRQQDQDRYLNNRYKNEKVSVSRNDDQAKQSQANSDFSRLPSYELEHHKQETEQLDNHNVQNDQAERIRKWREQAVSDAKKRIEIETKKIREHQQQG